MTSARTAILDRVRSANAGATSIAAAQSDWMQIRRDYTIAASSTRQAILALFEDRLLDYDGTVAHCAPDDIAPTLTKILSAAGVRRIGVPAGLSCALPDGFDFVTDEGLSIQQLNTLDAVLSRCVLAIAETGTLVLQNNSILGRRALTLIPDTHICLVKPSQVVATVPEAFAQLEGTKTMPTTFVSGPSATADIEMTRVKGVHGPRFLHVVIIADDDSQTEGLT